MAWPHGAAEEEKLTARAVSCIWGKDGPLLSPPRGARDPSLTLVQGGMLMFRWQSTCCTSSYFMALRKKDKEPLASRLLSRT